MQSFEHQVCHGPQNHRATRLRSFLVILRQPPASPQPSKRAFDYPTPFQHDEPLLSLGTVDDLYKTAQHSPCPRSQRPRVACIGPQQTQAGAPPLQRVESPHGSPFIAHRSRPYEARKNQTHRVYDKVALSTLYVFSGVKPANPPFSVVLTDWLSTTATLGSASRPAARRTVRRKVS